MEFKEMIKKACQVKNWSVFCLGLLFLWWGSNAVVRYWSQPLSTDISFVYGEGKPGDQFPLVTLCNYNEFFETSIIKECGDGSWKFISTVVSCMKSNKSFKEADLMQNLQPEIGNIVEKVLFWTGSKYVNVQHLDEGIWIKVFLNNFGPCYLFDLSKADKLNNVSLEVGDKPGLEFVMAENNPWQTPELIVHSRFDLPDAFRLLGYLSLPFSDETKEVHNIVVQKKINKKESTRKSPCVEYEYNACQSIENNELIFKRFNCFIPILYSGQHLDNFIQKGASNCSYQVMLEALDFILKKENTSCFMAQACESTRFPVSKEKVQGTWVENRTLVYISFENPEVEYRHSYISYDFLSMVGEIGGLLGLTLGASVLTFFESLLKCFSCQRMTKVQSIQQKKKVSNVRPTTSTTEVSG